MKTQTTAAREPLPRLAIMPCPDHAGKHPFHDERYLVTEGTEIERGHDAGPGEWFVRHGSLVATVRDCAPGTAAQIVQRCNTHPALVAALEAAQDALNTIRNTRLTGQHRDSYAVASVVDAALKLAKEGAA